MGSRAFAKEKKRSGWASSEGSDVPPEYRPRSTVEVGAEEAFFCEYISDTVLVACAPTYGEHVALQDE